MAALADVADRVGKLYWLNPEPRRYWNQGDSVMAQVRAAVRSGPGVQHAAADRGLRAVAGELTGAFWHREGMANESTHRKLTVERFAPGRFAAVNPRGGRIVFGTGDGEDFTPTELLLIAIGGCTAIDIDILTSRRSEPESFEIDVDADKIRDEGGNHLTNIEVTYRITFPAARRATRPAACWRTPSGSRTTGCARWGAPSSCRPRSQTRIE